jgi:hypothetical protein
MICELSMDKDRALFLGIHRYLSVVCGSLSPYAEEKNSRHA